MGNDTRAQRRSSMIIMSFFLTHLLLAQCLSPLRLVTCLVYQGSRSCAKHGEGMDGACTRACRVSRRAYLPHDKFTILFPVLFAVAVHIVSAPPFPIVRIIVQTHGQTGSNSSMLSFDKRVYWHIWLIMYASRGAHAASPIFYT